MCETSCSSSLVFIYIYVWPTKYSTYKPAAMICHAIRELTAQPHRTEGRCILGLYWFLDDKPLLNGLCWRHYIVTLWQTSHTHTHTNTIQSERWTCVCVWHSHALTRKAIISWAVFSNARRLSSSSRDATETVVIIIVCSLRRRLYLRCLRARATRLILWMGASERKYKCWFYDLRCLQGRSPFLVGLWHISFFFHLAFLYGSMTLLVKSMLGFYLQ